jgi:hypothetical protein
MRPGVDQIRRTANDATHELPDTTPEQGESTQGFTAMMLRLVYELEWEASRFAPSDDVE